MLLRMWRFQIKNVTYHTCFSIIGQYLAPSSYSICFKLHDTCSSHQDWTKNRPELGRNVTLSIWNTIKHHTQTRTKITCSFTYQNHITPQYNPASQFGTDQLVLHFQSFNYRTINCWHKQAIQYLHQNSIWVLCYRAIIESIKTCSILTSTNLNHHHASRNILPTPCPWAITRCGETETVERVWVASCHLELFDGQNNLTVHPSTIQNIQSIVSIIFNMTHHRTRENAKSIQCRQ